MEQLKLCAEGDKTFPKSEKVNHKKVTFCNRFGITLAADMYTPKGYFGKDAYALLKGDNKEFVSIAGAVHTDLYDKKDIIPFDKIENFFRKYLG